MALKQLSIYDFGIESPSLTLSVSERGSGSITKSVSEPKTQSLLRFLNRAVNTGKGGVGTYNPGSRKPKYFRFSYREGRRIKHRHIPGGNIYSDLALERAKQIQDLADREVSIEGILSAISSFK